MSKAADQELEARITALEAQNMAYIGRGLDNGVRNQFIFAATQGQTAFSGADSDGKTLAISDILYTDCFQNGVKLEPTTDYTVTLTSLTLVNAASLNDVVDIVSFDIFAVPDTVPASTGGTFGGGITATTGTFSGDVGIGEDSPAQRLEVKELDQTGFTGIRVNNPNGNVGSAGIEFQVDATYSKAAIYQIRAHPNGGGDLAFAVDTATDAANWVAGDEKLRVRKDGGITFNGDTAAANALDDYEEGTWTPSDQSGAGMSLTVWEAFYTKIGRKVFVEIGFLIPTNSSSAVVSIGGLPYTSKSGGDNTGGFTLTGTNSGRVDHWLVNRGYTKFGASTTSNVGAPNSSYSNKQIKLCGSYTTA